MKERPMIVTSSNARQGPRSVPGTPTGEPAKGPGILPGTPAEDRDEKELERTPTHPMPIPTEPKDPGPARRA